MLYKYLLLFFTNILLLWSQDCIDPYISGIDSCFNAGPSNFSATKSEIDITDVNNIRFEWNQCTDGGLFKLYIWDNIDGFPGNDLFNQLQLTDNYAGWNHGIIPISELKRCFNYIDEPVNLLNNTKEDCISEDTANRWIASLDDLWIGIREYTATQAIGMNSDNGGCSVINDGDGWQELDGGTLAYRLTTCLDDNPAGCFSTGCDDGYVCLDDPENNCVASNCSCDEEFGGWICTEDCSGGSCFLVGCMDPDACNYNADATVSDDSCAYELDCAGICGGINEEDVCGMCGGSTISEDECAQYYCNLERVSYLTFGQGLSDITGFYQDGREFAVVGLIQDDAASFVDITDPYNPFEVGRIPGTPSIWRDLKYWNRHVYIGTEAPDGVKVISVDDPDNPVLINTINDFTNSHNIHIDTDGFLYVVGASEHDIWIYELTDHPDDPTLIGTWNGEYLHDIEVYNNKIYGAGIYSGQFYIIDVHNKSNPETILSYHTGGIMTHDCAVTYDENYLITADETSGGHVKIWDISDYNNINMVSEYITHPDHSVHNIYVRPNTNLVIISYYVDGTRVLDITDPADPIEVGYFDTTDLMGLYDGNWGTYAYLPSGYIISSDRANGMFIFGSPLTNSNLEWSDCSVALGDVNFDGYLDILDIVRIINYILEYAEFSDNQVLLADINNDGDIDILDLTILSQLIINLN